MNIFFALYGIRRACFRALGHSNLESQKGLVQDKGKLYSIHHFVMDLLHELEQPTLTPQCLSFPSPPLACLVYLGLSSCGGNGGQGASFVVYMYSTEHFR